MTLELALAGVPTVAAYRLAAIDWLIWRTAARIHPVVQVKSVILPNLVLGELVIPEFLQDRCTAENLAPALANVIADTPARRCQIEAFPRLDGILGAGDNDANERAARAVLDLLKSQ